MVESKPLYIVDASVVLKWFLRETEDQEEALQLQNDYFRRNVLLGIPHYALVEIFNILSRQKIASKRIEAAFSMVFEFGFQEYPATLEFSSLALTLVRKFDGISFYDALYHSIALQEGGTFITADQKYFKKTKKAGGIVLLKDYMKKF